VKIRELELDIANGMTYGNTKRCVMPKAKIARLTPEEIAQVVDGLNEIIGD
jgi:hypothetical protein